MGSQLNEMDLPLLTSSLIVFSAIEAATHETPSHRTHITITCTNNVYDESEHNVEQANIQRHTYHTVITEA